MTILKVKINGETDVIFVDDYDEFVKEVIGLEDIVECKVLFIGTFCPEPEQNEDVYRVIKGGQPESKESVSLADLAEEFGVSEKTKS